MKPHSIRYRGYTMTRLVMSAERRATVAGSVLLLRKANPHNGLRREMIIPIGTAGYVALFEIEDNETVTLLALSHPREDDYH